MQNSANSATLFTTQTIHNVPFFHFVENVGLKKKSLVPHLRTIPKNAPREIEKKSMCSAYLEKDMLVSFRYCFHKKNKLFTC